MNENQHKSTKSMKINKNQRTYARPELVLNLTLNNATRALNSADLFGRESQLMQLFHLI